MSGAVAATLPRADKLRAQAEWPFEVGLVYVRDLLVDDTYQRPPHHRFISEMAANFDPTLVGTIDVNARKGGVFAVLDGQQRLGAMTQVGKTACYCSIYTGMSIQDEAGFFFRKNRDRKSMKVYYAFRARTIAGDAEAIAIRDTVEAQGFTLGESSNERDVIGAIRAIEIAYSYSSPHRDESLTPALVTIHKSVFGRKGSLDAWLIQGLGRFWQNYADSEVDQKIVQETLSELGPTNFLGRVREKQVTSSTGGVRGVSQPWVAARVLVDEYNRRKRKGARGRNFAGKLDPNRIN